jgi:uncharacterized protein (TIGR03435 family)
MRTPRLLGLTSLLVLTGVLSPNLGLSGPQPPDAHDDVFLTTSVIPSRSRLSFGGQRPPAPGRPVFRDDRMTIRAVTLLELVMRVYTRPLPYRLDSRSLPYRVEGGPKWMNTDRFDIEATMSPGTSKDNYRAMLRTLLRDRFKLEATIVTKDMPASALVIRDPGKGLGRRLRRSTADCFSVDIVTAAPGKRGTPRACALVMESPQLGSTAGYAVYGMGVGMPVLARYLSQYEGLVVDQTQLTGVFDFDFKWGRTYGLGELENEKPISVELKEQLGLTLRPTRAPEEVLVIKQAERPR